MGSRGMPRGWQNTTLWQLLGDKETGEAEAVKTTLNYVMPDIQSILSHAGTSPAEFTLHDAGHSFRVAERMVEVIPSEVLQALSIYELALLLLSAYLHDIGMTPERRKVILHYEYLLTGKPQDLSEPEVREFQKWLDDSEYGPGIPLSERGTSIEILHLAREIITYYCRARHNGWSEEWIRTHLAGKRLGIYTGWLDDLVALCRSHHEGYHELVAERFSCRIVAPPAVLVNLRYLAAVLRVADILEFDPERTPEVILRHRGIPLGNLVHWWKDHHISVAIQGNQPVITARPPDARIHRAVEVMVDQINEELRLCRILADEKRFGICPGLEDEVPHWWGLHSSVYLNINPREDAYEYIDGSFRPNTKKLLELFSGTELYGSPLIAVRELLQNAFDAVREQIAYLRLRQPDPADPGHEHTLGKLHRVELRFDLSEDGAWLICSDSGVGMTKAIIRDHFLVSGTPRRHEVLDLERRCKRAGFSLGRTGKFGIGVLSYFMLADRVSLSTRRSQEPDDQDRTGWHFETEGVGAFGELRGEEAIQHGTVVRLHLRSEHTTGSLTDWYLTLSNYLQNTLCHIPCCLALSSNVRGCERLDLDSGWTHGKPYHSVSVVNSINEPSWRIRDSDSELLSRARKKQLEATKRYWKEVQNEVSACLDWEVAEGDLPDGLGTFRIHLPYFQLPGGASLGFLRVRQVQSDLLLEQIGQGYLYIPRSSLLGSWNGMRIGYTGRDMRSHRWDWGEQSKIGIIEVNWTSPDAGRIAVSRERIELSKKGKQAVEFLGRQAGMMSQTFVRKHEVSAYAALNSRLVENGLPKRGLNWLSVLETNQQVEAKWKPLTFPLVSSLTYIYERLPAAKLLWKGKEVNVARCVGGRDDDDHYDGIAWPSASSPPDLVVVYPAWRFGVTGMWTKKPSSREAVHVVGMTSRFPPNWRFLCGVVLESYFARGEGVLIWNPRHPLLRFVDATAWQWCLNTLGASLNPLPRKDDLLSNRSRGAAWILLCLIKQADELWNALEDHDPSFLKELWGSLFRYSPRRVHTSPVPICQWVEGATSSYLRVLTPKGWLKSFVRTDHTALKLYLPFPGADWCLEFERDKSQESRYAPSVRMRYEGLVGKTREHASRSRRRRNN